MNQSIQYKLGKEENLGKILVLPSMIIVFGFLLFPFLYSFILSFFSKDLARPATNGFAGLSNYIKLLQDPYFLNSLKVTGIFSFTSVFFELLIGVAIALVLNMKFRFRGFVRGLIILPWALPNIVNASMWSWIYNANYGVLNALLLKLGLIEEYQAWLGNPVSAMILVILANVWKETPFTIIMVLAALQGVPKAMYEAAKVDGANVFKRWHYITLPFIKNILMVCGLLQLIWSLLHTFELIYVITRGGPFNSTDILPLRIYWQTFKSLRFGYGSAMSYLTALIIFIPTFFYIKSAYKSSMES
ncbi:MULTISPECIES: carbohydrate ABC transporter permease [unclassified Oceanispirochaeta]|uniref:carbohydrate ABC transporter permease n=1 Tax=unclassified Oceanispirochaeta TaxID=2635722 RepID=UPI000E090F67|nr:MULTISPECIES: sugar ABC transporter permease [unclassified Oceanispirochaeta]MBF9014631.1 sugar ABC transporter permease [Oceanispirochaeta sp. M2]NPD70887.1 sugar ABC transporter permease [Oceanispirochaeta sp. M1]RDG34167.1 sugar ABC transporter permease [Oceanispirochaeta sp. M1]